MRPRLGTRHCAAQVITLAALAVGATSIAAAQSRPVSRDEALWSEIERLARALPTADAFSDRAAAAVESRQELLEKLRVYMTAYPGGPRADEIVRLELRTLFEIGTLSGGRYGPLRRQVEEYLRHPPSKSALHEAAYWEISCDRLGRSAATSQPASAPFSGDDQDLLEAYRGYMMRYPSSRRVPRMAAALFKAAANRGDLAEMRQLTSQLRGAFPQHPVTEQLTAQLGLWDTVGKQFALTGKAADGEQVDTTTWVGRPVLVVVWAAFSERARACVDLIEQFRGEHPELRVVGVNLDESDRQMEDACRELGISWPQLNDGMGWANSFARHWGVREIPAVFVVDKRGRLVGWAGAEGWRELADRVLRN